MKIILSISFLIASGMAHADLKGFLQSHLFSPKRLTSLNEYYQHPFFSAARITRSHCYDRLTGQRTKAIDFRDVKKGDGQISVRTRTVSLRPVITTSEYTWTARTTGADAGKMQVDADQMPRTELKSRVEEGTIVTDGSVDGQAFRTYTKVQYEPDQYWVSEKTYDLEPKPHLSSSTLCRVEIIEGANARGEAVFTQQR